ncbi:MAG TPA: PadR family transcriptional regulator [Thermoleophilaceae bacterium]
MHTISLTSTSYVVLGLLERAGASTPYELKRLVAASIGNFWSIPHSQLYAEPKRLTAAGYLTEQREEHGRRRSVYSLTPLGGAALDDWRAQATRELPELRDLALLKVFFGADPAVVAPEQLVAHRQKLAEYERLREGLNDAPEAEGPARTLEAGIAHEREWVRYWERLA